MTSPNRPVRANRLARLVVDWRKVRRHNGGFVEIGERLDVHPESLRSWFKQWQIDTGEAPPYLIDLPDCLKFGGFCVFVTAWAGRDM